MFRFQTLLVAGFSIMALAVLPAQETGQRRKSADREQPGKTEVRVSGHDAKSSSQLDKYFVSCLRADNKAEVTIATLATQKATNAEVKSFAQQMVKDHTDFLATLDRFDQAHPGSRTSGTTIRTETRQSGAVDRDSPRSDSATRDNSKTDAGNRDNTKPGAADRDSPRSDSANRDNPKSEAGNRDNTKPGTADRDNPRADAANRDTIKPRTERTDDATNPPNARANVRGEGNRSETTAHTTVHGSGDIANQLMQIKQEISEQCVASAKRELSAKEGKDFDQCYMLMQVGAHMHMVDSLTVLNKHASPELQQILDDGLQATQQHLEHAKMLAMKIQHHSSGVESDGRANEKAGTSSGKKARKDTDNSK